MPVFALANAGVEISLHALGKPVSLAIFLGLVIGKPVGVLIMSWIAVRFGIATLFSDINWRLIASGSVLTGIGFTMSLFIAGLAFNPSSLAVAKNGILAASIFAASFGILSLLLLTSNKKRKNSESI